MQTQICKNLNQITITLDTLVLTANQRLALRTHQAYDKRQIDLNNASWPTPQIIPLTTWLTQQASQHLPKIVLNGQQELCLWENIIQQHMDDYDLLNPTDTASSVASAWQTLHLWNVDLDELAHSQNKEVAAFYQWASAFRQKLEADTFMTASEIPTLLTTCSETLTPNTCSAILLIGFDELPPAIAQLFQHLESHVTITSLQVEQSATQIHHTICYDQQTEINTMAAWAKAHAERDPQARIGCIIPQLETLRRTLFNVFTETFNPEQLLPGTAPTEKKFNISAGQRMSEYPIIRIGLEFIKALSGQVDSQILSQLLQSPYLHQCAEEKNDGACLDAKLRELHEYQLPLSSVFAASSHCQLKTRFIQRLHEANNTLKMTPQFANLYQWKTFFTDFLQTIGWPGYRTLSSEEYQLCMRWRQLLEEFTQLQLVNDDNLSLSQALYLLSKHVNNTIFQAEGSQSNVQILGVLEAAGNNFDAMWVMGLDDETWPSAPQPSPFIPYDMQAAYAMPHATAERELAYTRDMMHRLRHSANDIIFSAPQFDGDKHKAPSQLILEYPFISIERPPHPYTLKTNTLESLVDDDAPPISEHESVKGGAWLLKLQSECPFKAFAKLRLAANGLEHPFFGIAANERGNMTHDALERIWKTLHSQEQLNRLSDAELDALIDNTLAIIFKEQHNALTAPLKKSLHALEKRRLSQLIREWLDYEKQRPDFSVTSLESTQHVTLGTLSLTLRIDRIDTLATGEKLIIDYKTGSTTINAWFGERLSDPQLPLYACQQHDFNAIAFAEVRRHQCRFKGIASTDDTAKHVPGSIPIAKYSKENANWTQQTQTWLQQLEQLAHEFQSGVASVTPTQPSSCQYCDLQPLCRVEANA